MPKSLQNAVLLVVLGLPAVALLVFGPRREADVPPGRTVIHFWEKWTGIEAQAARRIVDRFNATVGADEGIWVDYNAVSNVDQRMLIATAGGDPPDIAGLYDYAVARYADQGALQPLDDLLRASEIDLGAFKPIWLEIGRFQGRQYAVPSTPYTVALYYNRRLFREAGLDPDRPPRTTAELNAHALRLTRFEGEGRSRRITQLGFTTAPGMLGWWHWIWPCFFGLQMWDGAEFHLDTPEGRAALEWIVNRRTAVGLEELRAFEANAGPIEGAQNPFLSERLAMVFQGPWMSNWIRNYTPDLDYAVAPFPSAGPGADRAFASMDVWVIPAGSRHPREAMLFLKYMLRQEVLEELCREHGKISPFRQPLPGFFEKHQNPFIRAFDRMASAPGAFGYPSMPTWSQASDELMTMHNNVLKGLSPDVEIEAAQRRIERIVSAYERMRLRRHGAPAGAN